MGMSPLGFRPGMSLNAGLRDLMFRASWFELVCFLGMT